MSICDLPDDVLVLVLRRCVLQGYSSYEFKANLPLVAVCRQWRRLALPLANANLFVQYSNGDCCGRDSDGATEPQTNLGLIAAADCAAHVRRVRFDILFITNHARDVRSVLELLRTVAGEWRGVRAVEIVAYLDSHHVDDHSINTAHDEQDIADVCGSLAALMPGVQQLQFTHESHNVRAQVLAGQLASLYSAQLRALHSTSHIVLPVDCWFPRLAVVNICCSTPGARLPRLDPAQLQKLTVYNAPADHSWIGLGHSGDAAPVVFPQLYFFSLQYNAPPAAAQPAPLQFLRLRNIYVDCPGECQILARAVLPDHMESICFLGNVAFYRSIAGAPLPAATTLDLHVDPGAGSNVGVMPYINHALSRAHLSDKVQLSIKDINLPVLPEHIICTALTKLSLATPTSMDAVVAFVGKLPRLTSLAIYCCTLVADELDLALPPFGDAAVPPLATKLCHLTFGIDWDNYSPEPAVQAAMFMLLRMRSLVHFIASQVPEQQVLELVRQYNPQYPHLQRIELLL